MSVLNNIYIIDTETKHNFRYFYFSFHQIALR